MIRLLVLGATLVGLMGCGVATKTDPTRVKSTAPEQKEIYDTVAPMPREAKAASGR